MNRHLFRFVLLALGTMAPCTFCFARPAVAEQTMFAPVIAPPSASGQDLVGGPSWDPTGVQGSAMRNRNLVSFANCVLKTPFAAAIMKTDPGSAAERQQFTRLRLNNLLCGYFARSYSVYALRGALEDTILSKPRMH